MTGQSHSPCFSIQPPHLPSETLAAIKPRASLPTVGPLVPWVLGCGRSPLLKRSSTRQLRRCGWDLCCYLCSVQSYFGGLCQQHPWQSVCWYPNPMAPRNMRLPFFHNTSVFVSCSRERDGLPRHPEIRPLSRCRVGSCLPTPAPRTPLDGDIAPLEAVARRVAQPVSHRPRRLWVWRAESQQLLSSS